MITLDEWFGNQELWLVKTEGKCAECGTPTHFIDFTIEAYFCCPECMKKFFDDLNERCNR